MDKYWVVVEDEAKSYSKVSKSRRKYYAPDAAKTAAEKACRSTGKRQVILEAISFCGFRDQPIDWKNTVIVDETEFTEEEDDDEGL